MANLKTPELDEALSGLSAMEALSKADQLPSNTFAQTALKALAPPPPELEATPSPGSERPSETPQTGPGAPAVQTQQGPPVFKKGPFKGLDKRLFFAQLADVLVALGSKGQQQGNFTPAAQQRVLQEEALELRRQEAAATRAQQLRRDTESRAFREVMLDKKIEGQRGLVELRDALEDENQAELRKVEERAWRVKAEGNTRLRVAADVLTNLQGLDLQLTPEEADPVALANDPQLFARVAQKKGKAERAFEMAKIRERMGAKDRERFDQTLGLVAAQRNLWEQGLRPPTQLEQQNGVFGPQQADETVASRVRSALQSKAEHPVTGVQVLQNDVMVPLIEDMARQAVQDFRNQQPPGSPYWLLPEEARNEIDKSIFNDVRLMAQDNLPEIREAQINENLSGREEVPERPEPELTPREQLEERVNPTSRVNPFQP